MHLKDWAPGGRAEEKGLPRPVRRRRDALERASRRGGIRGRRSSVFLIEQEGSRFSEFETAKRCLDNYKAMFGKA